MNVRNIIRQAIADMVTIDREEIKWALMELDITTMITDELTNQLPEAIAQIVKEEVGEAVSNAIEDQLS